MRILASFLAALAVVASIYIIASALDSKAAKGPQAIPQGQSDNGLRGMEMLHNLIGVLVQKMNVDVETQRRLVFAVEAGAGWERAQACILTTLDGGSSTDWTRKARGMGGDGLRRAVCRALGDAGRRDMSEVILMPEWLLTSMFLWGLVVFGFTLYCLVKDDVRMGVACGAWAFIMMNAALDGRDMAKIYEWAKGIEARIEELER